MENKISINATDIIDYRSRIKQKSYSFDIERRNPSIQNSGENQRKHSDIPIQRQVNQHSFLSRIRVSGGRERYNNQRHTSNAGKRYNSMQATSENRNQRSQTKLQTIQVVQNPATKEIHTYSPFSQKQPYYKICQIGQSDFGLTKKIKEKLCLDHLQRKSFNKHSPIRNNIFKNANSTITQQKFFTKMSQFAAEFDKTKIFEQEQEQLKLKVTEEKLSPYQLSIRRKNLNLIKMKLNSLGQKADDQQKNVCLELQRLYNETQSKKLRQRRVKRKDEQPFGNKKQMWPKKYALKIGSSKQWGEWSGQAKQIDNKFDIDTKTMPIRQIPQGKRRQYEHQSLSQDKYERNLKFNKRYQQPLIIF